MRKYLKKDLPYFTILLTSINVILFLICTFEGKSVYNKYGLLPIPTLEDGEYYRMITSVFLHADFYHLFNNMILLIFMGAMLEKEIGSLCFGVGFFLSGIGGSIVSLIMKVKNAEVIGSIGASGALFGMVGILVAFAFFARGRIPSLTPRKAIIAILLSLYNGASGGHIDNAAHVGGLIVGCLYGLLLCYLQSRKWRKNGEY